MKGVERWTEVRPLFEELLDVPPSERGGRISALRATDPDLAARVEADFHQVLDDLVLRIDRDRAAGEFGERNAMTAACEAKDDAFVHEALALQALADAAVDEKIDRSLLQHAGADRGFDFLPAARFDHDRVDAAEMQQVREKKTGRPCADDNDLRFHARLATTM